MGIKPINVLPLGFIVVILTGALLLMLPFSSKDGRSLSFLDAVFTATSATCVTGLVVADTGTHFSLFGQMVVLLLIQVGGLGLMTISMILFTFTGRKISLHDRMSMAEGLGESRLQGVVRLTRGALLVTGIIELIGAALLSIWGLPIPVVNTVMCHHQPSLTAGDEIGMPTVVHVADVVSHHQNTSTPIDPSLFDPEIIRRYDLTQKVSLWMMIA